MTEGGRTDPRRELVSAVEGLLEALRTSPHLERHPRAIADFIRSFERLTDTVRGSGGRPNA